MTNPNCRVLIFSILRFISTKYCKTQIISEIKSDMEKALSEEDYGLIKRKINALESYNNNLDVPLLSTRQIIMSIRKRLAEKMRK